MRLHNNININYKNTILAIFTIILLFFIFYWIDYLSNNGYIILKLKEGFENVIRESKDTSHTVNLPINTNYTCQNFCGPTARCSITGQQCAADIDCPGCMPYVPGIKNELTPDVPGDNDAGKLTTGVTPTYSPLTSTYQSFKRVGDDNEKPAQANFGVNTWTSKFDMGAKFFNQRYKPHGLQFMPTYTETYTTTGQFKTDGPLAANSTFSTF
jgi:hypothetical protein